jgi:hypothetical protein
MYLTLSKSGKNGKILYYVLHDRQASLSTPYALTVSWYSGTGKGQERFYPFAKPTEMDLMVRRLLARRMKDGYSLIYSFSRDARWTRAAEEVASEAASAEAKSTRRKKA